VRNPSIWTKETCHAEALKYSFRGVFSIQSKTAYTTACKKGWLDEICSHMKRTQTKKRGYWTKEKCIEEGLKYKTHKEFKRNSPSSYSISQRNGWLEEACSHMMDNYHPNGYWTKERCYDAASKCVSRIDFRNKYCGAVNSSKKNGWYEDICNQWERLLKPNKYWTKEKCHEIALKFDSRNKFARTCSSAARIAQINGWYEEICSHMEPLGNKMKRGIYAFEFPEKVCYIGLTHDFDERKKSHLTKEKNHSPVFKYIEQTGSFPIFKRLTDYLDLKDCVGKEGLFLEEYKSQGWISLNKAKTGSLGGDTLIWTKDKCKEEALKHKTRKEFKINNDSAYRSALRNGWLEEVCAHIPRLRNPNNYWTKDKCEEVAKKCKTRKEFHQIYRVAHQKAKKSGWFEGFCSHMTKPYSRNIKIQT
jgi:hypothetical protein